VGDSAVAPGGKHRSKVAGSLPDNVQMLARDELRLSSGQGSRAEDALRDLGTELLELQRWAEENVPTKALAQLGQHMDAVMEAHQSVELEISNAEDHRDGGVAEGLVQESPRTGSPPLMDHLRRAARQRTLTSVTSAVLATHAFKESVVDLEPGALWAVRLALAGTGFIPGKKWVEQAPLYGVSKVKARAWASTLAMVCAAIGYLGLSLLPTVSASLQMLGIWILIVALILGPAEALAIDHLRRVLFALEEDDSGGDDDVQVLTAAESQALELARDMKQEAVSLLTATVSAQVGDQVKTEYRRALVLAAGSGFFWSGCIIIGMVLLATHFDNWRWDHMGTLLFLAIFQPVLQFQFFVGLNFCPTLMCTVLSDHVRRLSTSVPAKSSGRAVDYNSLMSEAFDVHRKIESVAHVLNVVQLLIMFAFLLIASVSFVAGAGPRPSDPTHFFNVFYPRWLALLATSGFVLLGIAVLFVPARITASCDELVLQLSRLRMNNGGKMAPHSDLVRVDALEHFVSHIQAAGMMGYAVFSTRISYGFVMLLLAKAAAGMGVIFPVLTKIGVIGGDVVNGTSPV
jgi:hypothetical protein